MSDKGYYVLQKEGNLDYNVDEIITEICNSFHSNKKYFLEENGWEPYSIIGDGLLTTYDLGVSQELGKDLMEIMEVIYKRETFKYIEKSYEHYKKFILYANILDNHGLLEWGSSIRGAWFDDKNIVYLFCDYIVKNWNELLELENGLIFRHEILKNIKKED